MASIHKRERSKYWIAAFTDADGRRLKRSTKETDRRRAQKIADTFEEAARRRRTASQVRQVIADVTRDLTGEELPSSTVREYIERWTGLKQNEVKASTLTFYKGATNQFLEYLGERADMDIAHITRADITAFRDARAAVVAPRTANHALKCIRMLFSDAERDYLIHEDPTRHVKVVKRSVDGATTLKPFTVEQIKTILGAANDEWRSMIKFALYTGQRLGDIARLTWENVDLERNEIRLVTRKTGRTQALVMAAPLREHVETLPAGDRPDEPLHPSAYARVEREGKTSSLSNQFDAILVSAGLREKKTHKSTGKGRGARRERNALSFHSFRRTATTMLHEAGVPPSVVQELIGHDNEEIHAGYVSVGRAALADAASKLPKLGV